MHYYFSSDAMKYKCILFLPKLCYIRLIIIKLISNKLYNVHNYSKIMLLRIAWCILSVEPPAYMDEGGGGGGSVTYSTRYLSTLRGYIIKTIGA